MNTTRPCRRAARSNDSMFSIVLLSARLSATRPQAMPPGLRKSFWRSVITSAVRRASMVIPGLGSSMSCSLSEEERKSVHTDFQEKKGPCQSSTEALLPRELPEGLDSGVAKQPLSLLLGAPPGRDGLL